MAIELWHGGRRWDGGPEVRPSRRGRYECGPGIYLTNRYDRARKYAAGGGVTLKVTLVDNVRWLEDANLPREVVEEFVRGAKGLLRKKDILEDLRKSVSRMRDTVPASYLVNLCVNHDAAPGKAGVRLAEWLVEQGIDASLHSVNGREDWVVVFNPKVIRRHQVISASTIQGDADLPLVQQQ